MSILSIYSEVADCLKEILPYSRTDHEVFGKDIWYFGVKAHPCFLYNYVIYSLTLKSDAKFVESQYYF